MQLSDGYYVVADLGDGSRGQVSGIFRDYDAAFEAGFRYGVGKPMVERMNIYYLAYIVTLAESEVSGVSAVAIFPEFVNGATGRYWIEQINDRTDCMSGALSLVGERPLFTMSDVLSQIEKYDQIVKDDTTVLNSIAGDLLRIRAVVDRSFLAETDSLV